MKTSGALRTRAIRTAGALGACGLLAGRLCFAGSEAVPSRGATESDTAVSNRAEGFVQLADKAQMLDAWALTRQSSIVIGGTVAAVNTNVLLNVTNVLKGSAVPPTVAFPRPPRPPVPSVPRGVLIRDGPRGLNFMAGEPWLLFLGVSGSNTYTLLDALRGNTRAVEQAVKDVLELDSLADSQAKCTFLIGLINSTRTFSSWLASRELEKFNTPDNLPLFAGLAETNILAMRTYANLLGGNASPESVPLLRRLLTTGDHQQLLFVMDALARKHGANADVFRDLLGLLRRTDPVVRARAISILSLRGYSEAFPRIVECLDDPEPSVRIAALSWPWYAHLGQLREVLPRIRELACDEQEEVRASAYMALVGARDLRSFYLLWSKSVFDSSGRVRGVSGLDLLLEHAPLVCLGLLVWPTLVALAAAWVALCRFSLKLRLLLLLSGVLSGYILGACGGYLVGTYRAANPLIHALVLEPAVGVPLVVILIAGLASLVSRSPSRS